MRELLDGKPFHLLPFPSCRDALPCGHIAKMQGHMKVGILVGNGHEWRGNGVFHTQFLVKLSRQGIRQAFPAFHLATGELPAAALMLVLGPLAETDTAVFTADDGCNDGDGGGRFGRHECLVLV